MTQVNSVVLLGRLHKRPKLEITPEGAVVVLATLTTTTLWSVIGGGPELRTVAHRIIAIGDLALRLASEDASKTLVRVEGSLQMRFWTGRDCVPRQATVVVAHSIELTIFEAGMPVAFHDFEAIPPLCFETEVPAGPV